MARSTHIVIAGVLAAAGVFAVALRDDRRDGDDREQVMRDRTARRARAEADEERREEFRSTIVGPRPGQPGTMFDRVRFDSAGIVLDATTEADLRAFAEQHGGHLEISDSDIGPELALVFEDRDSDLWLALPDRWGRRDDGERGWIDDEDRLALNVWNLGNQIVLSWYLFETIEHMVAPGDPARLGETPFSVVGARIDDLEALLGARLRRDGDDYTWRLPLLSDSTLRNHATLHVDDGLVTSVRLVFDAPPDDVARALRAAYGPGASDFGTGPWRRGDLEIEIIGHPPDGATVTATRAN